jgi:phage baseplate assembly protein W
MAGTGREFLGVGWKFPIQLDGRGRVALAGYVQRVAESIHLILGTARGERLMLPQFGCGMQDLVFAPNTTTTRGRVAQAVRKALVEYEPRIDVLSVQVNDAPGEPNMVLIRVDYRVRTNNAAGNVVYPFFLQEGA